MAIAPVPASDFVKSFGKYKDEAQFEPVPVSNHGRISGYFVSVREFEELQRLRQFARRVYRLKELPREIAEAIKASKMDPRHDHLNTLLDE